MQKKWYKDWRSWLTILLLFFVPTFLIGLIVMWFVAPWDKKIKWWITGIGLGLPIFGVILTYILLSRSPVKQLDLANDAILKADVQEIAKQGEKYCLTEGVCPLSIDDLRNKGYLSNNQIDPKIGFVSLFDRKNCVVNVILSDKSVFSQKCISSDTLINP